MKKGIILLAFMVNGVFSYAQFVEYTPYIPEIPTSSIKYLHDMDAMNSSLLNYIVDLQSKILDMKLQTNDSGEYFGVKCTMDSGAKCTTFSRLLSTKKGVGRAR